MYPVVFTSAAFVIESGLTCNKDPCLDSNYDYVVTYSPNPTAVCIYLFAFASNDARQESYCKIIFHTNEHLFKLLEIIFNSFCA